MAKPERIESLRVSTIIKQFDDFLDNCEKELSPKRNSKSVSIETNNAVNDSEDSIENDFQQLLRKKPGQRNTRSFHGNPEETPQHSKEANGYTDGNSHGDSPGGGSKAGKGPRSHESIMISEAFSFLQNPNAEKDNDEDISGNATRGSATSKNGGMNSEMLNLNKNDSEDVRSSTNSLLRKDPDQNIENPPTERASRTVSEAFGFLKDLDEKSTHQVPIIPEPVMPEAIIPEPVPPESRVVSEIFGFLGGEPEEAEIEMKKLSTVMESELEGMDTLHRNQIINGPTGQDAVRTRSPRSSRGVSRGESLSEDQSSQLSEDDSEDDDETVRVIPGAWRNSTFAYIGTESESSSVSNSPRSASPARGASPKLEAPRRSSRPASIYPPDKHKHKPVTSSADRESQQGDSPDSVLPPSESGLNNNMPKFTKSTSSSQDSASHAPSLVVLSATDSERGFSDSIDDIGDLSLDNSHDSDVFEPGLEAALTSPKSKKKCRKLQLHHKRSDSTTSVSTTASEREYRSKYRSLQRTKILRLASVEAGPRQRPEALEVSREVVVEMLDEEKEYGFHIWGSKPVIISTVELDSAGDRAGLKIGDSVLTVNGINITEASCKEVVQITGTGSRRVTLGIGAENLESEIPLCCGYLNKQSGNLLLKKWRKRWVELKSDHCLYYYKSEGDVDPLGAVPVVNYTVTKAPELGAECAFKLTKYKAKTYFFVALSEAEMGKWANAITKAARNRNKGDTWLDISSHNVSLPALAIRHPDCHGYLYKMGNSNKTWRRRYCVLKDACLYYYITLNSSTAKGVAHFHGYSVQGSMPYNKRNSFMLLPPEPDIRTFYFYAENETELKRWLTAFQDSISKWVKIDD